MKIENINQYYMVLGDLEDECHYAFIHNHDEEDYNLYYKLDNGVYLFSFRKDFSEVINSEIIALCNYYFVNDVNHLKPISAFILKANRMDNYTNIVGAVLTLLQQILKRNFGLIEIK